MEWIYGINIFPIKKPIKFLIGENSFNTINYKGYGEKFKQSIDKNEILIYSVGKIIIIYLLTLEKLELPGNLHIYLQFIYGTLNLLKQ